VQVVSLFALQKGPLRKTPSPLKLQLPHSFEYRGILVPNLVFALLLFARAALVASKVNIQLGKISKLSFWSADPFALCVDRIFPSLLDSVYPLCSHNGRFRLGFHDLRRNLCLLQRAADKSQTSTAFTRFLD
jgi:hypothetical protein